MNPKALLHPFDAALQFETQGPGQLRLPTDANFWNQTGPFGGWLLAAGLKAVLTDPRAQGAPIEAHARFLAAPREGLLRFLVEVQAQGRSVGFWRVSVWQAQARGERLCAEISVLLAAERTSIARLGTTMPTAPSPVGLPQSDTAKARLSWLRQYDFRYIRGAPFRAAPGRANSARLDSLLWIRQAEERALDWPSLAAFSDVPAPRPFLLRSTPHAVATVSLSLYCHASAAELAAAGPWLLLNITGKSIARGFFDHAVELWSAEGSLLASSTQLAWFSETPKPA